MIHAGFAAQLQIPEAYISEDEGKALAGAIAHVQSFYGGVLDEKTQAWVNLAIIAGTMYVPRALRARARMSEEKRQARVQRDKPVEEQVFTPPAPAPAQEEPSRFVASFDIPPPPRP